MADYYYSTVRKLDDADSWFGPHASREAAGEAARNRFPDVGFWTAEAVPQTNRLDLFASEMFEYEGTLADTFDAANCETIGEDGEGGSSQWNETAIADLVTRLNYQFAAWANQHGYQRGWTLDVKDERWTGVPERAGASGRPVLSLAYDRERAA